IQSRNFDIVCSFDRGQSGVYRHDTRGLGFGLAPVLAAFEFQGNDPPLSWQMNPPRSRPFKTNGMTGSRDQTIRIGWKLIVSSARTARNALNIHNRERKVPGKPRARGDRAISPNAKRHAPLVKRTWRLLVLRQTFSTLPQCCIWATQ